MRHIIKLNGVETQVVNGIVEVKKQSPMPEAVYMTINFPHVVFKWMRPRSKIPGRKKEFTIRDIVEIDSKLCVHLKDGRNLGAGGIPEDHDNATLLSNELILAREYRPEATKQAEGIIAAGRLIAANAPTAGKDPWTLVLNRFEILKQEGKHDSTAWKEIAKIIVTGVEKSPSHTSDYLNNSESADLHDKIKKTAGGSLATIIKNEAARLLKKKQRAEKKRH